MLGINVVHMLIKIHFVPLHDCECEQLSDFSVEAFLLTIDLLCAYTPLLPLLCKPLLKTVLPGKFS